MAPRCDPLGRVSCVLVNCQGETHGKTRSTVRLTVMKITSRPSAHRKTAPLVFLHYGPQERARVTTWRRRVCLCVPEVQTILGAMRGTVCYYVLPKR